MVETCIEYIKTFFIVLGGLGGRGRMWLPEKFHSYFPYFQIPMLTGVAFLPAEMFEIVPIRDLVRSQWLTPAHMNETFNHEALLDFANVI